MDCTCNRYLGGFMSKKRAMSDKIDKSKDGERWGILGCQGSGGGCLGNCSSQNGLDIQLTEDATWKVG